MKRLLHRFVFAALASTLLLTSFACRREEEVTPLAPAAVKKVILNNQLLGKERVNPEDVHVRKPARDEVEWQAAGNADFYVVFFKREVDGEWEPDAGPFEESRFEIHKGKATKSGPVRPDAQPGTYYYGVEIHVGDEIEVIDPRVIVDP
jgi:hypothetical protein